MGRSFPDLLPWFQRFLYPDSPLSWLIDLRSQSNLDEFHDPNPTRPTEPHEPGVEKKPEMPDQIPRQCSRIQSKAITIVHLPSDHSIPDFMMMMEAHLARCGAKGSTNSVLGSRITAPLNNQMAGFEPAPSSIHGIAGRGHGRPGLGCR